jgi:hypothetical protein
MIFGPAHAHATLRPSTKHGRPLYVKNAAAPAAPPLYDSVKPLPSPRPTFANPTASFRGDSSDPHGLLSASKTSSISPDERDIPFSDASYMHTETWNTRSHLNSEAPPAWKPYHPTKDSLSSHLEQAFDRPYWVVGTTPGTPDTVGMWARGYGVREPLSSSSIVESPRRALELSAAWNARHAVAHVRACLHPHTLFCERACSPLLLCASPLLSQVLDGNPVQNGNRRLSPARRRHIGGVGFD